MIFKNHLNQNTNNLSKTPKKSYQMIKIPNMMEIVFQTYPLISKVPKQRIFYKMI